MNRELGWTNYIEEDVCIYCGCRAEVRDHAAPYSWRHSDALVNKILVPSCAECNAILSDSLQPTLGDRIAEAKDRLRRRYKHLLAVPTWTTEELGELSESFRATILVELELQARLQHRLAFDYWQWRDIGRPRDLLPLPMKGVEAGFCG